MGSLGIGLSLADIMESTAGYNFMNDSGCHLGVSCKHEWSDKCCESLMEGGGDFSAVAAWDDDSGWMVVIRSCSAFHFMVHRQAAVGRFGDSLPSSSQSHFPHAAAGWELCSVLHRSEVLDAARNTVRIKICYIMIALTLLGCLAMVITGKEVSNVFWITHLSGGVCGLSFLNKHPVGRL